MKKIIHVDNSEFFRKLMGAYLQKEGFEFEGFDNPQEADMVIGSGSADMVIMGLTFADIGGPEFLERIKEFYGGPVIVLSSSLDKDRKGKLLSMGANAAINKSGPWQQELRPYLLTLKSQS